MRFNGRFSGITTDQQGMNHINPEKGMNQNNRTELKYRIALTMAPAIGPITARKLIEKFGSARAIFDQKKEVLEMIEGIGPRLSESITASTLLEQAEKEMVFLDKHRISALYFEDPHYPQRLNQCADGPILLYTRGEQGLHCRKSLSVVGTRRATPYGRDMCRKIIQGLSAVVDDLVIVSGLAYGIDVMAHRAALENGLPTIAVLGHGLSTIYPHAHRDTAKKIIDQGTLVTDFHSRMGPERNNFLRRNRIIAGLSHATLVIESAKTGGSLITAVLASSYDRDVLAVPGRTVDERSKGCNGLIKSNLAAMVESHEDVIHHLNWEDHNLPHIKKPTPELFPTEDEQQLLHRIQEQPGIVPGILSNNTGISIQKVLSLLMEMELKQWISVEPGNRYQTRITLP
ncbi:MAG: DNA-processing protein DprA [Bacteroidota bacterium]